MKSLILATMLITGEPNGLSVAIPEFKSMEECTVKIPVVTKLLSGVWDRHVTARCTEHPIRLGSRYNPFTQKVEGDKTGESK